MSATEINLLKEELVEWIGSLDDANLLNFLNSIRQSKVSTGKDWFDDLTLQDRQNLQHGLEDMEKGRVLSSEDFWTKLSKDA